MINFNKCFIIRVVSIVLVVSFVVTTDGFPITLSSDRCYLRKQIDFNIKEKEIAIPYLCTMLAVAIQRSVLDGNKGKTYKEILGGVISENKLPELLDETEKQGIRIEIDKQNTIWVCHEPCNIYIAICKDGQFGPKKKEDFELALNNEAKSYQVADSLQTDDISPNDIARKQKFDSLFLHNGKPTGYLRNLVRHFDIIKALVEGKPVNPVSIEIQPSGTCNINCRYCGFKEKRREHKDLYISEDDMRKLIEDIDEYNKTAPYPLTEIKFNGIFSEPLAGLAKKATILGIRLAVEKGFWIGLFTNGLELDHEVAKTLVLDDARSAAFVNISIDAGTWETYHKLKRSGISREQAKREYVRIINNIRSLVVRRNILKADLNISISCVLQKETSTPEEIARLIRMAKELGVDNIRFRYPYKVSAGAPIQGEIKVAYDTIGKFIDFYKNDKKFSITQIYGEGEVQEQMQKLFDSAQQEKRSYTKCRIPYLRLTVSPDGNFYPCDHRGYIGGGTLGNIKNGYKNFVENEKRLTEIDAIRPQEDLRCEICAMYNQYLNELIAVLEAEYKIDPTLFTWLKQTYQFEKKVEKAGSIKTITEEQIETGINKYIQSLPPNFQELYDLSQPIEMHHEGPSLKHHLQAMLDFLENSDRNPKIPEGIKRILSDPSNKEFFIQFILFHDIGKSKGGENNHALISYEIAKKQPFNSIDGRKKEMLLKAIEYHMDIQNFKSIDPHLFLKHLQKIGLDKYEDFAGLLAAAVYLDGRSTWSDEFGNYNLPNVDSFIASYEAYCKLVEVRKAEIEIVNRENENSKNGQSLEAFLRYLKEQPLTILGEPSSKLGHLLMAPTEMPLNLTQYRDVLAQEMVGDGGVVNRPFLHKDSFKGFESGKDYDPSECIASLFSDTEFLDDINLLVTDTTGFKREEFNKQTHLIRFMHDFLARELRESAENPIDERSLDRIVDKYTEKMVRILTSITETAYPYYGNEVKDCILKYFPSFVNYLLDNEFREDATLVIKPDSLRKIFADMFIKCLHYQVSSMSEYNEFLSRQLFLTLQIFYERFERYAKSIGFSNGYVPVFLLCDAEPLSYPFFGLFGATNAEKPEFVYFNRLATMTFPERTEYYARDLDKKSEYTKALYAANTRIYTFLNGSGEKGTASAILESIKEAQSQAHKYLYEYLRDEGYTTADDKTRKTILEEAYARYRDDVERFLIVSLSQKILDLMRSDEEARIALGEIYSFLVPESLKGSENKDKKAVIVDTGIKGSLALLLSSLVFINDIDSKDEEAKSKYLSGLLMDAQSLRLCNIRARAFIYGTTSEYRSVVPNAGFERFGFGGANSFIEQLPKFIRPGFLNGRGMPEVAIAGDINLERAQIVLKGLKKYVLRKDEIKKAASLKEVEALINKTSLKTDKPLYLFIDLDNVMIQPLGYMASESWYQTEADTIPYRNTIQRQRHFGYYKRYERHLTEEGGYELILDIQALRKDLMQRFPGREIKIICFSARNETQRQTTEKVLQELGISKAIDDLSLAQQIGASKKQRFLEYLTSHGVKNDENRPDIIVIDDALHNLAPLLSIKGMDVIPILFADSRENYREKSGLYFFIMANEAFRQGEVKKAKEYYINALKNKFIPLSVEDIRFLGNCEGNSKAAIDNYIRAIEMSHEWLGAGDIARISSVVVALSEGELGNTVLSDLYSRILKINKSSGNFKDVLIHLYRRINNMPPDNDIVNLWERLEKTGKDYEEGIEFFQGIGITREKAIENAILDYAFEFGNALNPPQYAAKFIQILSIYFPKDKVMSFFPEGSVFKEEFQWIDNDSIDNYEYYYSGSFFIYHNDKKSNHSFLLEAKTYQELKVKFVNRLFMDAMPYERGVVKSVTVFPTIYCNVGCPVCIYSSPPEPEKDRKDSTMYLSQGSIAGAVRLINSYQTIETLVIGGGGEPFLELSSVEELISKSNVKNIKIYTSGDWGKDMSKVNQNFLVLHRAITRRSSPVNIEINLSTDEFHSLNIEGRNKVAYLVNILHAFMKAKDRGRFTGVSLHLRGLNKDGNVSKMPDTVKLLLEEFRKTDPQYTWENIGTREDGYTVRFGNGVTVDVSYNKLMLRNKATAENLITGIKESREGFLFDRVLVNSGGTVSLGGYYKAIPLGMIKEMPPAMLANLSCTNMISAVMREKGFSYLLRLAGEYNPNLARLPPLSLSEVDLMANIMRDSKAQLYIYYRVILDLLDSGKISEPFAANFGITKGMTNDAIRKMAGINSADLLEKDKAKKLNWGFRYEERKLNIEPFSNIWWDTADNNGREIMRERIRGIQSTEEITSLINRTLREKYGLKNPDIKSVTVVGGYLYNPSNNLPNVSSLIYDIRNLIVQDVMKKWGDLFRQYISSVSKDLNDRDIENVIKITKILLDRPTIEAVKVMKELEINNVEYLKKLFLAIQRSDILQDVLTKGNKFSERVFLSREVGSYAHRLESIFNNLDKETIPLSDAVYPQYMDLFLSDSCFSKCVHCHATEVMPDGEVRFRQSYSEIKETIDESTLMAFLEETLTSDKPIRVISMAGIREPLADKRGLTLKAIKKARELSKEVIIKLYTDGIGLQKTGVKETLAACVNQIRISVDAASSGTWQRIHNMSVGNFEEVVNNIKELVKLRDETGSDMNIGVSFLLQKFNYRELLEFLDLAARLGVNYVKVLSVKEVEEKRAYLIPDDPKELDRILSVAKQRQQEGYYGNLNIYIEKDLEEGEKDDSYVEIQDWENKPEYDYLSWLATVIIPDGNMLTSSSRLVPSQRHKLYEFGKVPKSDFLEFWNAKEDQRREMKSTKDSCTVKQILLNSVIEKVRSDWKAGISPEFQPFRPEDLNSPIKPMVEYENKKSETISGATRDMYQSQIPVKDLDLVAIVGNKGIRDFIPETPFFFGDTFAPGISSLPKNICVWIVSEEYLSPLSDNIIDIDLALTLLSGIPILGNSSQTAPAPIIERIKQAYLFLNLLLKMNSDMDVIKLYKRKIEIGTIFEQLRKISNVSKETLLASPNISVIDKEHIDEVLKILKNYFIERSKFDREQIWQELDQLYRLTAEKIDETGRAVPDSELEIVLSAKRREILEYAKEKRAEMLNLIEKLYQIQERYLASLPVQKPRSWLVDIFKANTPSRSLAEHLEIANNPGIDYSTAVSLATISPYPTAIEVLYHNINSSRSSLRQDEKDRVLLLISRNPGTPRGLQKKLQDRFPSNPLRDLVENILVPSSYNISSSYRKRFLDFIVEMEFAGTRRLRSSENMLGKKYSLIREAVESYVQDDHEKTQKIYERFHNLCDHGLSDQAFLKEELAQALTTIIDRVLYSPVSDGTQLFATLKDEECEALISKLAIRLLSSDSGVPIFKNSDTVLKEIMSKQEKPCDMSKPLHIGVLTFPDKEGPSVSNRVNISTMEAALRENGFNDVVYEVFDLQFEKRETIHGNHFDILVLDVRQENFENFCKSVEEFSLEGLADYFLIQGSYLSIPGALDILRSRVGHKLKDALIVVGEPEPAILGLADRVRNRERPLPLVPNVSIKTSTREFKTPQERMDISVLKPSLYPYIDQMKSSGWYNYNVETSRGCQHGICTFCTDRMLYGPGWRPYSVESVLNTFRELNQRGIDTVFVYDKDFWGGDYERAEKIARGLIAMGNKVRYTVALRPDEIIEGEHLLDLFKESGLSLIFIGPEAYEYNTLRRFNKGVDAQMNLEAIEILREHGIDFGLGFIIDPLATIEEVGESLRTVKTHRLWQNTASLFNVLRVKKGTGYEAMMRNEGLLGELMNDGLTYMSGYKDTRVATMVQTISECLEEVPPLNFIFIISKRRLPLKTDSDRMELEKYNKYFAILQKINLNLLLSLTEALESGHADDIKRIKQEYVSDYKGAVKIIRHELNPANPISKNILEYIEFNMNLKEARKITIPFPERVSQAYKDAEEKTRDMVTQGLTPKPYNPERTCNISLVAGVSDITKDDCDFPKTFRDRLTNVSKELSTAAGDVLLEMPEGRYRLSLFNIYLNELFSKWDELVSHPVILENIRDAVQKIRYLLPLKVHFKGFFISEQGAIMLKGFVEDDSIGTMRKILHKQFPKQSRDIHLDKPFIGITVGRIAKDIDPQKFRELCEKVKAYGEDDFGEITVRRPVLEASADFSGFIPFDDAQVALQPLNKDILETGPRLLLISLYDPPSLFGVSNITQHRFPLALNTLKGYVKNKYGNTTDVVLLDNQKDEDIDKIIRLINKGRFDLIGFSVTIGQEEKIRKMLNAIQERVDSSRRPLVVLGNNFFDENSRDFLKDYPWVIICRNEGEYALGGLIEYLRKNRTLKEIPNILYVQNGAPIENPIIPVAPEDVVRPVFDTLDQVIESGGFLFQWEASRGCPWGLCRFCTRPKVCKGWRAFPVEKVLNDLEALQKRGLREVYFADEDFIGLDFDRAMKIAQGIIDRGIKMEFSFSTSVRDVFAKRDSPEEAKKKHDCFVLLKKAGFKRIMLGLESGSDEQLKRYAKGVTVFENSQAIKILRDELGYDLIFGFIMFDPFISVTDVIENLSFIDDMNIEEDLYALGKVRIGDSNTYFLERLRKEGLLEGRKMGANDYKYRFKDNNVAAIVSITDIWKNHRYIYNEWFNKDLAQFAEHHEYLGSIYRSLQLAIRKFDVAFLKAIALCYAQYPDHTKFLQYLKKVGYTDAEIENLISMIEEVHGATAEEQRQEYIGKVIKVLLKKRSDYVKKTLQHTDAQFTNTVDYYVRSIAQEKIYRMIDDEAKSIISSFISKGYMKKQTSVKLIGFTHQKHYVRRNDLSVEVLAGDLRGRLGKSIDVTVSRVRDEKELQMLIDEMRNIEMPDIIGISVHLGSLQFIDTFMQSLEQMESFKRKRPLVVFGNMIPTYFPEKILQDYPRAIVVRGEGEESLYGLVGYVEGLSDLYDISNLVYIDEKTSKPVYTKFEIPDFRELIYPPSFETVDQIIAEGGNIMLQTSRGCSWGRCTFCSKASFKYGGALMEGKEAECWDGFPMQRVLDAFETLYSKGINYVEIVDEDQFVVDRKPEHLERLEAIVNGLKRLIEKYGRKMQFIIFVRPETIYRQNDEIGNERIKQLIIKLKEVGLIRVFLSADSGSQQQLKRYLKGITPEQVRGSVKLLEELGLDARIGFIMFDPELTLEDIIENIKFFREYNLVKYNQLPHRSLEVFVGTPIAERLKQKGLLGDLDINYLRYQYRYEHPEVERIYQLVQDISAEATPTYASCREANKYFIANKMEKEVIATQKFMEEFGNIYLDLMEELALNIKGFNEDKILEIMEKSRRRVHALEEVISKTIDLTPYRTEKVKDLSRGQINEEKETHPALDEAANDGRMFAVTLEQFDTLQEMKDEALVDILISNLIHLRSPPETKDKLIWRLKDPIFKEKLLKGFDLMRDSIKDKQLSVDKKIRLCIVIEDKDLPAIVFKDPYNNLIAHSGKGEKTNTPYTSIYAGYNSLNIAITTGRQDVFRKLITHEANDIIRGFHIDELTEDVNKLYDDTLAPESIRDFDTKSQRTYL